MIANKYRFHGYGSLKYVYRNGEAVRSRHMTIKYTKNPRRKLPRISIVVSKKVIKSAVARNRIRRRLYEQFRLRLPDISLPHDIVCIVSLAEVRTMPTEMLTEEINGLLQEAGICNKQM